MRVFALLEPSTLNGESPPQTDEEKRYIPPRTPDITHKRLQRAVAGLEYGLGCNTSNLKVGVCIAGLARKFATSEWSSHFRSELIEPIYELGARGLSTNARPDIFADVTLGEGNVTESREDSGHDIAGKREYVLETLKELNATSFLIEEGNGPGYNHSSLGDPSCYAPLSELSGRYMSYFHSISGCYSLLEKNEKASGSKYDIVMFFRPDAEIFQREGYVKSVQCTKSLFITDHFSIQQRSHAHVFGNIWDDEFANPAPPLCHRNKLTGETIVQHAISKMEGDGNKIYAR